MSHCENIDGKCGASWCDCDYQRRKKQAAIDQRLLENTQRDAEWEAEMKAHKIEQMHDFLGERETEEEE